jgi:site-specific DNA-methyltransferase (adenine-specific)
MSTFEIPANDNGKPEPDGPKPGGAAKYGMLLNSTALHSFTLYMGDCLEQMANIPDGSVDLILTDLPYGTTACPWDAVIPLEPLWAEYKRIGKPNAAIVLTATQPFTSMLIASNYKGYKHNWVWKKNKPTGFQNAKRAPLRDCEDVLVFSNGPRAVCYNPQGLKPYGVECYNRVSANTAALFGGSSPLNKPGVSRKNGPRKNGHILTARGGCAAGKTYIQEFTNYPRQLLEYAKEHISLHPTQKPVSLMEYLVRTYSNDGDTVLDNCMGSGTTGAACAVVGNRHFIGIERDPTYFQIASDRIDLASLLRAA